MKIAIPLSAGRLSLHFGHCEEFAVFDVDEQNKTIVGKTVSSPPAHEPGALPKWLRENGVNVVLVGGMGRRAQQMLAESGITVLVGVPAKEPEALVDEYLKGELEPGTNICDH